MWLMEFVILVGLWALYVGNLRLSDLLVGIGAAALAATADEVVKSQNFAPLYPHVRWLLLFFWEPWYVLKDTLIVWWALARQIAGRESQAAFRAVPFRAGGDDSEDVARRALAITLTTISPNCVLVGIDRKTEVMLLHHVIPAPTPRIAQKLGAQP